MSPEKNTLTADRDAASKLATEIYNNGTTHLSEIDELDNQVAELNQESYRIPVHGEHGDLAEVISVKNIGDKAVQEALAVHSGNWQNPDTK